MSTIQLKLKLFHVPTVVIFLACIMFTVSCMTEEDPALGEDLTVFSFGSCPVDADVAIQIPVDPTTKMADTSTTGITMMDDSTFVIAVSWPEPFLVPDEPGVPDVDGPIIMNSIGRVQTDLTNTGDFPIDASPGAVTTYVVTYTIPDDICTFTVSLEVDGEFALDCPASVGREVLENAGNFDAVAIEWDSPVAVNIPAAGTGFVINAPTATTLSSSSLVPDPLESGVEFAVDSPAGTLTTYVVAYTASIDFTTATDTTETVTVRCDFEIRLLAGEDNTAPMFRVCASGVLPEVIAPTPFSTADSSVSDVPFSDLVISGTGLLTALRGQIADDLNPNPTISLSVVNDNSGASLVDVEDINDFPQDVRLPVGTYTVTVNAMDAAGNELATPCEISVTIELGADPGLQMYASCPSDFDQEITTVFTDEHTISWTTPVLADAEDTRAADPVTIVATDTTTPSPTAVEDSTDLTLSTLTLRANTDVDTYMVVVTYPELEGASNYTCSFTITVTGELVPLPLAFTNCPNTTANVATDLGLQMSGGVASTLSDTLTGTGNEQEPASTDPDNSPVSLSITMGTDIIPDADTLRLTFFSGDTGVSPAVNPAADGTYNLVYLISADEEITCLFTVTIDNMDPVLTCPQTAVSITINQASLAGNDGMFGVGDDDITVEASILDEVQSRIDDSGNTDYALTDSAGTATLMLTSAVGDIPTHGNTQTVTYGATDEAGNPSEASCMFEVTVDTIAPTLMCPAAVVDSVEADGNDGNNGFTSTVMTPATWTVPTANDAEQNTPVATTNTGLESEMEVRPSTDNSPTQFSAGEHMVTYTVSDDAGNQGACTFTVTVEVVDGVAPTFDNCPEVENPLTTQIIESTSLNFRQGNAVATVIGMSLDPSGTAPPTAMDNSGLVEVALAIRLSSSQSTDPSLSDNLDFFTGNTVNELMEYTITYTAADMSTPPQTAECIFTVTIDNMDPVLTCPQNNNLGLFNAMQFTEVENAFASIDTMGSALAPTDNDLTYVVGVTRGGDMVPSMLPSSDTIYEVTYKANDDAAGNIGPTCTFTISVDVTAPMVVRCPTRGVRTAGSEPYFLWRIADSTTIGFSVTDTPPGGNQVRVTFGVGSGSDRPTNNQQFGSDQKVRGISDLFVTVTILTFSAAVDAIVNSSLPLANGGFGTGLRHTGVVVNQPYTISFIAEDAAGNKTTGADCPSFTFTRQN